MNKYLQKKKYVSCKICTYPIHFCQKNVNLNIGISSQKIKFNRHKQIHKYLILDMLLNILSVFILEAFFFYFLFPVRFKKKKLNWVKVNSVYITRSVGRIKEKKLLRNYYYASSKPIVHKSYCILHHVTIIIFYEFIQ